MSPNSNMDRQAAGERLKAFGFEIEGGPHWQYLVIHHSGASDSPAVYDWPSIKRYHMSYRYQGEIITKEQFDTLKTAGKPQGPGQLEEPWPDIGYHAGIELADGHYRLSVGRPANKVGFHVAGLNPIAFGICFEGNWDVKSPPEALWEFGLPWVLDLMRWWTIPVTKVIGHREAYDLLKQPRAKTCPGSLWSMEKYRAFINQKLISNVGGAV